jgi:Tol biopolymer transport system component
LGSLWLADPISGEYTSLAVPGYGAIDGAAASPDGRKVVYAYRQNNLSPTTGIWLVDSTGRETKLLTEATGDLYGFAWSPNGTQIAFFGEGLMVMDADGTNLRKMDVKAGAICNLLPPLWSSDSKKLALVWSKTDAFCKSWAEAKGYSGTEIVLVNVESGKGYSLSPDQGRGYLDPAWSPDGSKLAFIAEQGNSGQLYIANADGSNFHQLITDSRLLRSVFWQRQ